MHVEWPLARFVISLLAAAILVGLPLAAVGYVALTLVLLSFALLLPALWLTQWCLGWDGTLPAPGKDSEKGISEALGALAFVLTQVIAVVASQIGQRPLWTTPFDYVLRFALWYVPVTIAVLGSIVGMIRSTKHVGKKKRLRTFDSGSLRFMRYVFGFGVFFAFALPLAAYYGMLPRQAASGKIPLNDWIADAGVIEAEKDPELAELQRKEFVGAKVVKVNVPIAPRQFTDGMPRVIDVTVTTKPNVLQKNWRVGDGDLFIGDPSKKTKAPTQPEFSRNIQNPKLEPTPVFDAKLKDLQAGESYTLVLTLWKSGAKPEDAKGMADFLNSQREKALDVQGLWARF